MFISDILIIRKLAETLEQRATRLADLAAPVGNRQHAEAKLQLLLARGEDAVTQSNVCEDVLLRALRRMLVLAEWGYTMSLAFLVCLRGAPHSKTTYAVLVTGLHAFAPSPYRQTDEECNSLIVSERVLLEKAAQQRLHSANQQMLSTGLLAVNGFFHWAINFHSMLQCTL